MCKAIEKKMKKTAAGPAAQRAMLREVLAGVDFDIAPPQVVRESHVSVPEVSAEVTLHRR